MMKCSRATWLLFFWQKYGSWFLQNWYLGDSWSQLVQGTEATWVEAKKPFDGSEKKIQPMGFWVLTSKIRDPRFFVHQKCHIVPISQIESHMLVIVGTIEFHNPIWISKLIYIHRISPSWIVGHIPYPGQVLANPLQRKVANQRGRHRERKRCHQSSWFPASEGACVTG